MSPFTTRKLNQTATLWETDGIDSAGDPSFSSASPTAITVRWEDRVEKFLGSDGEERIARSVIYVREDMEPGDYIFLGTETTEDPRSVRNAFLILDFSKIPDIKSKNFERKVLV